MAQTTLQHKIVLNQAKTTLLNLYGKLPWFVILNSIEDAKITSHILVYDPDTTNKFI